MYTYINFTFFPLILVHRLRYNFSSSHLSYLFPLSVSLTLLLSIFRSRRSFFCSWPLIVPFVLSLSVLLCHSFVFRFETLLLIFYLSICICMCVYRVGLHLSLSLTYCPLSPRLLLEKIPPSLSFSFSAITSFIASPSFCLFCALSLSLSKIFKDIICVYIHTLVSFAASLSLSVAALSLSLLPHPHHPEKQVPFFCRFLNTSCCGIFAYFKISSL